MSSTASSADQPGFSALLPWRSRDSARSALVTAVLPASRPGAAPSTFEPALENASAFWLATAEHRLVSYLQPDPIDRLYAARAAFTELGLAQVADRLDQAIAEMSRGPPQQQSSAWLSKLERELPSSRDRLDELTACFAARYAEHRQQPAPGGVPAHVADGGDSAAIVDLDGAARQSPPSGAGGGTQ